MADASESDTGSQFFQNVMPKSEIGALSFLKEHPEYDGRDVLIAIFDTGVDPGTNGLQITTDGRPKIVDVLDCSGSGDVDTSQVVEANEEGIIEGVNGKKMKLNPNWSNPKGEWHIGVRPAFELLSSSLCSILKERRLKTFEEKQRAAVTKAQQDLTDFKKTHPKCSTEEDKKTQSELESRVQLLLSMMSNYKDPGPMIDCVVWHDGEHWRSALDTSDFYEEENKGRLADFVPLADFHLEHRFGTVGEMDPCNFASNVYEDGNLLSLVFDSGSHGTHVSGIAAAYHPESPEFNGIAPGARILALKISDVRIGGSGSMETSVGLIRAAIAAIRYKVDVVNLSFGESYSLPNSGRPMRILSDLVYKHGILFIVAAGNDGPAISSISAAACTDGAYGIGAYVSPEMAKAAHSVIEEIKTGKQYTFSSRGPVVNGLLGIDVSTPGGAISNVPQWSGRSRMLASGTSMAAPNATGGAALLISGLKQTGGKIFPTRLHRAMTNTAVMPKFLAYDAPPELTYGHGLLQVEKAWEYLTKAESFDALDIRFNVNARRSDDSEAARNPLNKRGAPRQDRRSDGIYIREPLDVNKVHTYACTLEAEPFSEKLGVEVRVGLESTVDWVKCPELLLLLNGESSFEVVVDGTRLRNDINYAEVQGFDTTAKWRGPLFRLPITVIHSNRSTSDPLNIDLGSFDLEAGTEVHRFVPIPYGATWAELTISTGDFDGSRLLYGEVKTLVPDMRIDDLSLDTSLLLVGGDRNVWTFPVVEGRMMEICFAQCWSSFGETRLSFEIEFHGVGILQGSKLTLDGSVGNLKIQVVAPLRREKIKPSATLNCFEIPLSPSESTLTPLNTIRDTLPDARVIHKLLLTYKLKLQEGGKITTKLQNFNRQLYNLEFEGQMIQVFDVNKKLISVSDCYTKTVTVKKGDYTIQVMLRHDNAELLKKYENVRVIVEKALEKPITVPIYKNYIESTKEGDQVPGYHLFAGQMSTLVLGPVTESLPKDCAPGLIMTGTISLGQCNLKSGTAPSKAALSYIVPPKIIPSETIEVLPDELPVPAKMSNAARDAKIKTLESLSLKKDEEIQEFEQVLQELKLDYPGHLPLLTTALKKLDGLSEDKRSTKIEIIFALCEEIVTCIDKVELACFIARKCPDDSKEGKKRSREATEEKEALILALEKQLVTLVKQQEANNAIDESVLRPVLEELKKWADPKEPVLAMTHAKMEASCGRHGEAIKLLDCIIQSDKAPAPREIFELKASFEEALGWKHWARYEKTHTEINFPKKFALF